MNVLREVGRKILPCLLHVEVARLDAPELLYQQAELRDAFAIAPTGVSFRAAGLVSIMLDTQRRDLMRAISNVVCGKMSSYLLAR